MLVDAGRSTARSTVTGAIQQASQATGTSFKYLLATAQVESGFDPQAGASTSSARGLFQFIDQTWLATMKQSGDALGYGRYAAAITQTTSGRFEVKDPQLRSEILKLRNDPTVNAVMAGAFTKANADGLTQRLGRPPSEGELYIAHFLGVGGAARLITLAANNPDARAAGFFSHAARANPSIFFDSSGAPRTVAQVRNVLVARYDVARGGQDRPTTAQAAAVPAAAAPDTAGIASVFANAVPAVSPDAAATPNTFAAAIPKRAAQNDQIFHGLFADPDRTGAVAPIVSALWGVPTPAASGDGQPGPSTGGSTLDLFKDSAQGT